MPVKLKDLPIAVQSLLPATASNALWSNDFFHDGYHLYTPLSWAIKNSKELAVALIQAGASTQGESDPYGESSICCPLEAAVKKYLPNEVKTTERERAEIAQLLIDKWADIAVSSRVTGFRPVTLFDEEDLEINTNPIREPVKVLLAAIYQQTILEPNGKLIHLMNKYGKYIGRLFSESYITQLINLGRQYYEERNKPDLTALTAAIKKPSSTSTSMFNLIFTLFTPERPYQKGSIRNWTDLETLMNSNPLNEITLPQLPDEPFIKFSLNPYVKDFVKLEKSNLALALSTIFNSAILISTQENPVSPNRDQANCLLDFIKMIHMLYGWQHAKNYITNKTLFLKWREEKNYEAMGSPREGVPIEKDSIEEVNARALALLKRLYQRVNWMLELQGKLGSEIDAEFYIKVIAADKKWVKEVDQLYIDAEHIVTNKIANNKLFDEFRKLSVSWPYAPALEKEIKKAGLVHSPMLLKRGRCVCTDCGIEIFGLMPWSNPWSLQKLHNTLKHRFIYNLPTIKIAITPVVSATTSTAASGSTATTSTVTPEDKKQISSPGKKLK
ncbi:hypothetical protein AYO45_05365 [Gammaproteobacteria bacterium SCGC AG-212-F23]|nr:hypothetical protein AYO45_05365 [Gammaproteobacteria bacterium SCGC AG-212-F23]